MNSRQFSALAALASGLAFSACKDGGNGPAEIGPPSSLTLVNATVPTALANTQLTSPIQVVVKDANGRVVPNAIVTFAVSSGGGSLTKVADTSDANGVVEVTGWKLGKSALPQKVTATTGAITLDVNANVQTSYNIEVRFFGPTMTDAQKALFTNAAARLEGIVIGDVINADARGQNIDLATSCNVSGQPPFSELVDDVIIYASIRDIDGPGKILAQAGPCLTRDAGTAQNPMPMPAVGEMQFDSADLGSLTQGGSLQEVITHEMLHVLGFGVLWEDRGLVSGAGTSDPRYTGAQGRQGCVDVGGTVSCALSVPLENTGGAGTVESHWREATFNTELMTGFIDQSPNALSKMTIGSLADLGYVVNNVDFDDYQIFVAALRAPGAYVVNHAGWEQRPAHAIYQLKNGTVTVLRMK
jgi:hypothetical protein